MLPQIRRKWRTAVFASLIGVTLIISFIAIIVKDAFQTHAIEQISKIIDGMANAAGVELRLDVDPTQNSLDKNLSGAYIRN